MATAAEIRQKFESQPRDKQEKILRQLSQESIGTALVTLSANPNWEGILCHHLGLQTELEKQTAASMASAEYTRRGFNISVWALTVAGLSTILSVIALLK